MKMDLSSSKIHLVLCPVDMRSGFRCLSNQFSEIF